MRRALLAAAAVAATVLPGTPGHAGCSVQTIVDRYPFECSPPPPGGRSYLVGATGCGYHADPTTWHEPPDQRRAYVTSNAYVVPFAVRVLTQCVMGSLVVEEVKEGPVGFVTPAEVPAVDIVDELCFRAYWWYSDGTGDSHVSC